MLDTNEQFTDNSRLEKYRYCKTCRWSNGGDNWSNRYDKSSCAIYKYPETKPNDVYHNGACDFYDKTR